MDAVAIIEDFPRLELLPRELELVLPGGFLPERKFAHIDFGAGFPNRAEFYEKMFQRTNHPDGREIFNMENFDSFMKILWALDAVL